MFNTFHNNKNYLLSAGILSLSFLIFKFSRGGENKVILPNALPQSSQSTSTLDSGLELLVPAPAFSHGMLAFGDYKRVALTGEVQWASFIELRQIQSKSVVSSSIKIENLSHAIDPQFSPDGERLLCKVGSSLERYAKYKIAMVNLANKKITYGPEGISYLKILWSPNSKYIAYVRGGDAEGNELSSKRPLQLFVYNVQTDKEKLIAQNPLVTQFCWTPANTLIFCQQSGREQIITKSLHPSIYEVKAEGGLPHLLVADGFDPQPSPDNQKLAFFGWASSSKKSGNKVSDSQALLGLYVYNRNNNVRDLLYDNLSYIQSSGMKWTLDSDKVIFLQQIEQSPNAKARLNVVSLSERKVKQLAVIRATDFSQFTRSRVQPQFDLNGMSNDGNYAYIKVSEYVGEDDPYLINQISLLSVDVRTGESTIGAKVITNNGVDWKDLSP